MVKLINKLTACALYGHKIVFCFLKKWFGARGTEEEEEGGDSGKGEEEEQNKQEFIKRSGGREGDRGQGAVATADSRTN